MSIINVLRANGFKRGASAVTASDGYSFTWAADVVKKGATGQWLLVDEASGTVLYTGTSGAALRQRVPHVLRHANTAKDFSARAKALRPVMKAGHVDKLLTRWDSIAGGKEQLAIFVKIGADTSRDARLALIDKYQPAINVRMSSADDARADRAAKVASNKASRAVKLVTDDDSTQPADGTAKPAKASKVISSVERRKAGNPSSKAKASKPADGTAKLSRKLADNADKPAVSTLRQRRASGVRRIDPASLGMVASTPIDDTNGQPIDDSTASTNGQPVDDNSTHGQPIDDNSTASEPLSVDMGEMVSAVLADTASTNGQPVDGIVTA